MTSTPASNASLPVGRRIEAWRKTAGMTRQELAAMIHVSPHRLGNIETGRTNAYGYELSRMATVLDVTVVELMDAPMA